MDLLVQKYGGSSLATPRHVRQAALRIRRVKESGRHVVVVVSAMGRMTDYLIKLAHRTVAHPAQRELDMLLSTGERISMALLAMALHEEGLGAISFTGSQSGIVTSQQHTEAKIIDIRAVRIKEELAKDKVVIIAGFQGVSETKEITTLGRGGSDTSAVALAVALNASACEILTDVDGLYTADPRIVPEASLIPSCSYDVGLELASLGAKMQARSLVMAKRFSVRVRIASSSNEECRGSWIGEKTQGGTMERMKVTGVASKAGYHYFRVRASLQEFTKHWGKMTIPIRYFQFREGVVSFLCEETKATMLKDLLDRAALRYDEIPSVATVSLVGDGIEQAEDMLPKILSLLWEQNGECLMLLTNSLSITVVVSEKLQNEVCRVFHRKFIEELP